LQIPLIGIHHIEGHIFANLLSNPEIPFPHICLTVSGGHTLLVHVYDYCKYELLGGTVDDAAGEAFDKIAKFLDLGFPGGPIIDRLATEGNRKAFNFPRPLLKSKDYYFSFSGLKTAIINAFKHQLTAGEAMPLQDIASSFQEAVVDVLVAKTIRAAKERGLVSVSVTGGVSANRRLREAFTEICDRERIKAYFPTLRFCTDNAAMIAAAGHARLGLGYVDDLSLDVIPNVPLEVQYAS
jgi:N6-L-threonylcarbamoyladenine synthase